MSFDSSTTPPRFYLQGLLDGHLQVLSDEEANDELTGSPGTAAGAWKPSPICTNCSELHEA